MWGMLFCCNAWNPNGIDMWTRQAFNALRSRFKTTYAFVIALFKQRDIQIKVRMIVDACKELHKGYHDHLESQEGGSRTMLQWCAERANGTWYQTICRKIKGMLGPTLCAAWSSQTPLKTMCLTGRTLLLHMRLSCLKTGLHWCCLFAAIGHGARLTLG